MRKTIALVSCGSAKLSRPAPAGELYTGSYHRALLEYAQSYLPKERILILSAKHGLLPLNRITAPYNTTMGDDDSVQAETVREQAAALGLLDARVLMLAGARYRKVITDVWPDAHCPLPQAGMGKQIQWLKQNKK